MTMKASEAAQVLTAAATIDKRTIGEADARMWAEVLPERIGPKIAVEAVKAYYRENRDWIMPADVVKYASKVGRDLYRKAIDGAELPERMDAFRELPSAGHRILYSREQDEALASGADIDEAHAAAMRAVENISEQKAFALTPAPLPASHYTEL